MIKLCAQTQFSFRLHFAWSVRQYRTFTFFADVLLQYLPTDGTAHWYEFFTSAVEKMNCDVVVLRISPKISLNLPLLVTISKRGNRTLN